ncbi:uncharacterized protein PHALS_10040 [Plasmopara halstedii]|uniref:Uncharacterized protein n=1 Tax=Plasmopara halstedii TaxID=4781 RepID=A0A0P1AH55_PLAHL|nr:uncharacterized protein PHALS_10040 [Plasmopara halstedii]CEG39805.1 hypothetical protein PHALS_10040 [Plasmopara halstedii]|eukprot:XP_024576174.1 hypothetical protein PHALS_10040 [Plasmopara halstedii]
MEMKVSKVTTALRRILRVSQPLRGDNVIDTNICARVTHSTKFTGLNTSLTSQAKRVSIAVAVSGAFALAISSKNEAQSEQKKQEESGYDVNPIQNVSALLRLYEQIDQNMTVFVARMLENLERSVEDEKKANNGKLKLSPEQRALKMSIEFESTLEKVQDAVFRNNYVTKEQVQEAMQELITGTLRGGGPDGKISVAEAESIDDFVRKLGRLRWKATGSRESLIPGAKSVWKEEKPNIDVTVVISVMEELIPSLTVEMERIAIDLRKEKLTDADFRIQLSQQYVKASGKKTKEICDKYNLDLRAFQAALMYYHDDALFETVLSKLSAQQQMRFKELGL